MNVKYHTDKSRHPGLLGRMKQWLETKHIPLQIIFIVMGIASTIWFLIRVIPKPTRATYPCVRVAAPVMSGFVIYLLSLGGISISLRRAWKNFSGSRYLVTSLMLLLTIILLVIVVTSNISESSATPGGLKGSEDGPNTPFGKGVGIKPGLVVWAWNPGATNENCKNSEVNYDLYFNPVNADQNVIGNMFSESVKNTTGKTNLKESWDCIFRYHNSKKYKKDKGYTSGEKIFIKINQGTANWALNKEEKENGYTFLTTIKPGKESRSGNMGATETSPYIVLELLRELVNIAGINQSDIFIGDPIAHIYGHNYAIWHAEFPDVKYVDRFSDKFGRTLIRTTDSSLVYYSDKLQKDKLYDIIESADYIINVANLKPHNAAGISLTAKNHFGSLARESAAHLHYSLIAPRGTNPANGGYHKYRVQVDLMGSKYLGKNTILYIVDGLFGGGSAETKGPVKYFMAPFNNDWSNSIFISMDQVALESVCYDFLRSEWDGKNKHNEANNTFEEGPNMYGVDDYLHQAADSKNWPEGIIYDPDNSGKPLTSLGVHEHWNNAEDKQYSGNLGLPGGITLMSIPDTLVKSAKHRN